MILSRSITTQFTIVFVLALLLIIGSFYLVLDSVYRNELKSQAETVADNVDAFGSWVSQYGRVWVRDDNKSYLGRGDAGHRARFLGHPRGRMAFLFEESGTRAARILGSCGEIHHRRPSSA